MLSFPYHARPESNADNVSTFFLLSWQVEAICASTGHRVAGNHPGPHRVIGHYPPSPGASCIGSWLPTGSNRRCGSTAAFRAPRGGGAPLAKRGPAAGPAGVLVVGRLGTRAVAPPAGCAKRRRQPGLKSVVTSLTSEDALSALRAGANEFIHKDPLPEQTLDSPRRCLAGTNPYARERAPAGGAI